MLCTTVRMISSWRDMIYLPLKKAVHCSSEKIDWRCAKLWDVHKGESRVSPTVSERSRGPASEEPYEFPTRHSPKLEAQLCCPFLLRENEGRRMVS